MGKFRASSGSVGGGDRVGYGRPPSQHRFKKGTSGNPRGRPRGSKSFVTLVLQELDRTVPVNEGGVRRRISKREAGAKQLVNRIAMGDLPALRFLMDNFPVPHEREDPEAKAKSEKAFREIAEMLDKVAASKAETFTLKE